MAEDFVAAVRACAGSSPCVLDACSANWKNFAQGSFDLVLKDCEAVLEADETEAVRGVSQGPSTALYSHDSIRILAFGISCTSYAGGRGMGRVIGPPLLHGSNTPATEP